jgi:hypothetical protein
MAFARPFAIAAESKNPRDLGATRSSCRAYRRARIIAAIKR